jgi:ABC-type glycerol-3-phosphate transport system permease component
MVAQYLFRNNWFKTSRTFLLLMTLFSAVSAFMGFWQVNSIDVIENFPPYAGTVSGFEWLRLDIPVFTTIIEIFSGICWISNLVIAAISIIIIIKFNKQFRNKDEDLRQLVETENQIILEKESMANRTKSIGKYILRNLPFYFILVLYLIFTLFPVYLAVRASLSTPYEINNALDPRKPLRNFIVNYSSVMFAVTVDQPSFQSALTNSIIIGFGTSLLGMALSLASAYGLARFKFRGKTFLTFVILSTQMFPGIILLIPQFIILSDLGLLEENFVILGLLLVMSTSSTAYVTWMMKGYFETIPEDIEEAAFIDGYGRFRTFIKIVIPLAKSGIVAVMVFTFLSAWQEFVLARTFIQDFRYSTLPLLFFKYQNLNAPDNPTFYELLSPYSILVAAPVVAFYLVLQKQLVSGAIAGSVK